MSDKTARRRPQTNQSLHVGPDMNKTSETIAPRTAMADAMTAAGYQRPAARLMGVAIEAWSKHPGIAFANARVAYLREALQGEMTWHLIEEFQPRLLTEAIESFLRHAAETIAAQKPIIPSGVRAARDSGGACVPPKPKTGSPPPRHIHRLPSGALPGGRSGMGQDFRETQTTAARPAPTLKEMADKQQASMAAKVATTVRLSMLDKFPPINGMKLGDLTPREAIDWVGSRERDIRFVKMLTANLPQDRPIREFVTGDMADELYARAEQVA